MLILMALLAYVGGITLGLDDGRLDDLFNFWLSNGLLAAATLSCIVRGVVIAKERLAWLTLGAGMLSWTIGDIYWTVALADLAELPFPSMADAFYLGFYPAGYIALALLVRARIARFHASLWLDGLLAGLAIASLGAVLVLAPVLQAADGSLAAVVTNLAYPLADIVLLALVVGVIALTGWRPTWEWVLLGAGLVAFGVADSVYLHQAAVGAYEEGTILDAGWAVGIVLMGLAALQPTRPGPGLHLARWRMLVVPTTFALVALGVIVYSHFVPEGTLALALAVATLIFVMVRMGLTFRENLRLADSLATAMAAAATDSLTGLFNHRAFHERLGAEVERAHRHHRELSLIIFDLDHFKRVNDDQGHQAGDKVLAEVAQRLKDVVRVGDILGRVGGEEFAVLLPETDGLDAWEFAERAREAIAARPMPGVRRLTVSAGVCGLSEAGSADNLYRLADGALYWAKGHGRDACIRYAPEVVHVLSAEQRALRLEHSQALNAIRVLARAVDAKDSVTQRHSERVADMSVMLATAFGWPAERAAHLREAALVHDVGKIGVPDALLFKPGRLTPAERAQIEAHAALGARMVADVLDEELVSWVRHHHERHDGAGYPDGLRGEEIPEGARLLAVADCWDAMTASRPYRAALSAHEALEELRRGAGSQWSPEAVVAFERLWDAGVVGLDPTSRETPLASEARAGRRSAGEFTPHREVAPPPPEVLTHQT